MFSQATSQPIVPSRGFHLTAEDIGDALQPDNDILLTATRLISLENTLSGVVFPQDDIKKIRALASAHGIGLHLDGARLWNVAAKEVEARRLDATQEEDLREV
jgi:threonine aldolase